MKFGDVIAVFVVCVAIYHISNIFMGKSDCPAPEPTTTSQLRYPYHDVLNLGSRCPKEGCGDQRILGGGENG